MSKDILTVAGRKFSSRLIIGTGKYKDYAQNAAALRVNISNPNEPMLVDFIDPKSVTYLPNTAGCFTGEDAVRTLRLAREGSSLKFYLIPNIYTQIWKRQCAQPKC